MTSSSWLLIWSTECTAADAADAAAPPQITSWTDGDHAAAGEVVAAAADGREFRAAWDGAIAGGMTKVAAAVDRTFALATALMPAAVWLVALLAFFCKRKDLGDVRKIE
jgi:hypothetical protein